jgi:type I restriction enzyme M protein
LPGTKSGDATYTRRRKAPTDRPPNAKNGAGDLGFEAKLWTAADKLRGNLDASEYKNVVLGLIFLKYISDAFTERNEQLRLKLADPESDYYVAEESERYYVLEDRDEYVAENVFWVPPEARWQTIQAQAKQPGVGKAIDDAMVAIEKETPKLRGVLPKDYARETLDKRRLGELIDLIGTIGLGDLENRSKDILGRVYEYFLGQFASAEGRKGGEFYTPRHVVRLLVAMLAPEPDSRVFDPCCGSGGMFVQSESFVEEHGGRRGSVAVYGQESNPTTWRLCQMNLAIRGIDAHIELGDSFHDDRHKDRKADYVLANPPFNVSDWGGELLRDDVRWKYGAPPVGNANFAWVQHFIHHLSPRGVAGFVLANGSMSAGGVEGEIRKAMIEADLVDCVVALPSQLFYTTQIPVCLWFLARDKRNGQFRDRRGETLFIDARTLGVMVDRTHRELTHIDIERVASAYHAWRDENPSAYRDVPGFCRSAAAQEIKEQTFVLTPGRYVGVDGLNDQDEPFAERFAAFKDRLKDQFAESRELANRVLVQLEGISE